jgi:D-3-phosphoglycerate dehydrogenase
MSRLKVLLTNLIDPSGDQIIQEIADIVTAPDTKADTLRRMIADADALVVRTHLPTDIFDRPHRLRGVVRHGVGLDMIPMEAATRHVIPVANVPAVNAEAVAEYCISGMLLLVRRMHRLDCDLRAVDWNTSRKLSGQATELFGRTVGIVGVGNVGGRVAEICRAGFRMRVLGNQRRLDALPDFVKGVDVDTLFRESDFIVLNCPLTPETQNLVNVSRIGSMKPTACIVNASRGQVIDEQALVDALRNKRIGGAVLDVYCEQPLPRDNPLLTLDNVILTPHAAGITQESMRRMSQGAAKEIVRLLAGERPVNLCNPEIWDQYIARRRANF